jgi:hypothetical protein
VTNAKLVFERRKKFGNDEKLSLKSIIEQMQDNFIGKSTVI